MLLKGRMCLSFPVVMVLFFLMKLILVVVLCVDYSRTTGDIAAGTMGERNEVLVMKRRSLCVSCKAQEMD